MSSRLGEGLADQAYFGALGDEWWDDWASNGYTPLPAPPELTSFSEGGTTLPDIVYTPPDPGAYDTWAYDPGTYDPGIYDPGLYDPGLVAADPSNLATAVAHSTSDVLRSLPYQISPYEEDTLVAAAQAAIHESATTGQPIESTLGQWASSLSDAVRSLLPAVVNRVLGGGTQPRVATGARPPATTAGFNATWLILGGLGVIILASAAGGRRVAYARVKSSRRAPSRARRAPRRRRR